MTFQEAMDHVAQVFEGIGAVVLLGGLVLSVVIAGRSWRREHDGRAGYQLLRRSFGGAILLGLEILIAADLLRTVAVAPSLQNVVILGIIVLIRTFLSFSLEIEIDGVAPWRRALLPGFRSRTPPAPTPTSAGTPRTSPGQLPPNTPSSGVTSPSDTAHSAP
jgi:uncharacterized membrane protein